MPTLPLQFVPPSPFGEGWDGALHDLQHFLYAADLLELIHDGGYDRAVVDTDFYCTVEDAFVAGDGQAANVDVKLSADEVAEVVDHTLSVDTAYLYGGIKKHLLVHLPLGVEDAITIARLQACCHGTGSLVDLHMVLVVDKAQDVVARNGVTAVAEDVHLDGFLGKVAWYFLVKVLAYLEESAFQGDCLLFFLPCIQS